MDSCAQLRARYSVGTSRGEHHSDTVPTNLSPRTWLCYLHDWPLLTQSRATTAPGLRPPLPLLCRCHPSSRLWCVSMFKDAKLSALAARLPCNWAEKPLQGRCYHYLPVAFKEVEKASDTCPESCSYSARGDLIGSLVSKLLRLNQPMLPPNPPAPCLPPGSLSGPAGSAPPLPTATATALCWAHSTGGCGNGRLPGEHGLMGRWSCGVRA